MSNNASKSASVNEHRKQASEKDPVLISFVTVSDSRTPETDENIQYFRENIDKQNQRLSDYYIVRDEPTEIESVLEKLIKTPAQVIIFNGGTGISKRDRTFDVLSGKLEKTLPGFGEIFRMLSYQEVGSAAMLSRATAGVYKNKLIISIPGSPNAVQLAWEKLLKKELKHLAWEILR
ncbi:MAG: molybdenum cofactor biosynthesis protein MoaB [Candidatus Omnitrophica bacterium]|nr:molybdenum cofactor biosynthesis protein MoaB [Candidatus Omnitrophota bacterium]